MSVSYSYACSQQVVGSGCYVCLNSLDVSNVHNLNNSQWHVVALPQCNHLIHQGCFDHWSSHTRELAARDVSIDVQPACPLCKVKVEENHDFQKFLMDCYLKVHQADHDQTPDPSQPLPLSEAPEPDNHCDTQSLRVLFDKAVSVDHSDYYFNVSNFPALHQMKNRYGFTLSAKQLDVILKDASKKIMFRCLRNMIDTCAANKIRMAFLLRSDDEASKEKINDFFRSTLGIKGPGKKVIIDFLLEQEILDKESLQKGFEFYIKLENYPKAAKIHEKHDLHLEHEMLKKALMQAGSESNISHLSRMTGNSEYFQQVKLEALKTLNERTDSFDNMLELKEAVSALLVTGISDKSEINKSLRLAVLGNLSYWPIELHQKYGATLEPEFLKEQLEGAKDSCLIKKINSLFDLRADDDESTEALFTALMRVLTVNYPHCNHLDIERLINRCLNAGIRSQQLVNKALTRAIDMDRYSWAVTLNKSYQAFLDPQTLKDYLLNMLDGCSSGRRYYGGDCLVGRIGRILSFANKEDKQTNEVALSVLNRLLNNSNLSREPEIEGCINLLLEFNELNADAPQVKRKKIASHTT